MNQNSGQQRTTRKGLGWVPDEPDERDYELYREIRRLFAGTDSKNSLKRIHRVLSSLANDLPFPARKEVELLEEDLENFEFVRVNTYKVLYEGEKDRRVVILKFLMVYFYQHELRSPCTTDICNVAIKSIVEWALFELKDEASSVEALKKKLQNYGICIPRKIWDDRQGSLEREESLRLSDRIKDDLEAFKEKLDPGEGVSAQKDFLGFLGNAKSYWLWLNSEEYDYILTALIKAFQAWVNQRAYKDREYKIYVDGIVGIQTYTWLREWLKTGSLDPEKARETVFSRIPFPTAMPTNMIKTVLTMLYREEPQNDQGDGLQDSQGDGAENDRSDGEVSARELIEKHFPKDKIDAQIEKLARENFFEIEPIIAVITQISGPVGTFPKTLETALEISVKVFLSFLDEKFLRRLDKKIERATTGTGYDNLLYLAFNQKRVDINAILSLGRTVKLPEKTFLELEEESENIGRLRDLVCKSVDIFTRRVENYLKVTFKYNLLAFDAYLKEIVDIRPTLGSKNQPSDVKAKSSDVKAKSDFLQAKLKDLYDSVLFLSLITRAILDLKQRRSENNSLPSYQAEIKDEIQVLINNLKNWSRDLEKYIENAEFPDKYSSLSSFEFEFIEYPFPVREVDSEFKELITLELIEEPSSSEPYAGSEEESRPATSHLDGQKTNEINQWLFPSYSVPGGADLLKNRRVARKRFLCTPDKKTPSVRVYTYLPQVVDLSLWCSPVSDQGAIQSCSAQAGAALVEYFVRRYSNNDDVVSRRFLYKITRNLMGRNGDSGASLRDTIKAMALFGVPPEEYWHYDEAQFDEEPTPFCYSFAQNYQALNYFRLDHQNVPNDELLIRIKIALAAGFPSVFGFTLHESIYDEFNFKRGYIPYPGRSVANLSEPDNPVSGHALLTIGYHDFKTIMHSNNPRKYSKGAFLVRNSWGTNWGLNGYGWLPYDYVLQGLTSDWWSLIKLEWLESGKFGLGGARDLGTDDGTIGSGG